MSPRHLASEGKEMAIPWDDMDFLGRLQFILTNRDLFLNLRLVTESEISMAQAMKEEELQYILERESMPIFTSINLKKAVEEQEIDHHRENLKAALNFLSQANTLPGHSVALAEGSKSTSYNPPF